MKQERIASRGLFASVAALVLVALYLAVATSSSAQAPDAALEDEMYRIADQLNCPICQGQRLSECPIQVCEEMREEIILRLQQGQEEKEIIQAFVDRYGIQVLNQPPIEGFNVLAWTIPFVGLAVLVLIGAWALRQWSRRRVVPVAAESTESLLSGLPEEYVRRLEEEVASEQ